MKLKEVVELCTANFVIVKDFKGEVIIQEKDNEGPLVDSSSLISFREFIDNYRNKEVMLIKAEDGFIVIYLWDYWESCEEEE